MNPYNTRAWRTVRALILARDRAQCQVHLPGCKTHANQVDHIIDWRDSGAFLDPSNLRASCSHCNLSKRNRGVAARARTQRETQQTSRKW